MSLHVFFMERQKTIHKLPVTFLIWLVLKVCDCTHASEQLSKAKSILPQQEITQSMHGFPN